MRGFVKPLSREWGLTGSCDQFYINDREIVTKINTSQKFEERTVLVGKGASYAQSSQVRGFVKHQKGQVKPL